MENFDISGYSWSDKHKHKLLVKKIIKRISRKDPLDEIYSDFDLPMFTKEEVQSFNNRVYNDEYREQVLNHLRRNWSPDIRKCVKILFEKLMDYSVIIQFSWTGKTATPGVTTQKEKFSKLEGIFELFVEFCNSGDQCHPDKLIISEIQIFLKRSNQTYRRMNKLE